MNPVTTSMTQTARDLDLDVALGRTSRTAAASELMSRFELTVFRAIDLLDNWIRYPAHGKAASE